MHCGKGVVAEVWSLEIEVRRWGVMHEWAHRGYGSFAEKKRYGVA